MAEVPESLVSLVTYLEPPSALTLRGRFPDCQLLFNEICEASPTNRKRVSAEFVSLCRITGVAWIVWGCCGFALTAGIAIIAYCFIAEADFKQVLISRMGLNGTQTLCVIATILLVFLLIYYFVRLSCNQKAKDIEFVIRKKTSKRK